MNTLTQKLYQEAQKILEQDTSLAEHEKSALLRFLQLLFDLTESTYPEGDNLEAYLHELSRNCLASSHLLSIIQELNEELNAIKRLSITISSSLELQTVLDNIAAEAISLIHEARTAHIFLYKDGALTFGAARFARGDKHKEPFIQPRPNGLTVTVVRRKQIIAVPDMKKHPLYANAPTAWRGSILGIPIKMGDTVVGVMNVSRYKTGDFSEREVHLLSILAQQAAIAISNACLHEKVKLDAKRDALTHLPNRRALDTQLEYEISRSAREKRPFSVLMIDLDGFKAVNDTHGHIIGDQVLAHVAKILKEHIRGSDFLARYGGDELTLILPNTSAEQSILLGRKLNKTLYETPIKVSEQESIRLGFSGGVAEYPRHAATASGLLRMADAALYYAKEHCRGNIVSVDQLPPQPLPGKASS